MAKTRLCGALLPLQPRDLVGPGGRSLSQSTPRPRQHLLAGTFKSVTTGPKPLTVPTVPSVHINESQVG